MNQWAVGFAGNGNGSEYIYGHINEVKPIMDEAAVKVKDSWTEVTSTRYFNTAEEMEQHVASLKDKFATVNGFTFIDLKQKNKN